MKPWHKEIWCTPETSAEYVACMEDVLEQYEQPYDPEQPLVSFDEWIKQHIEETRIRRNAKPGLVERYEYKRNGVRSLFVDFEPLTGKRHTCIHERRTKQDFAYFMKWLVDEVYPKEKRIRFVMDNFNTHKPITLYETFPSAEALRILKKCEFHFTSKHGSGLNVAEIKLSVIRCKLKKKPDDHHLASEMQSLVCTRNSSQASILWQFRFADACIKLKSLYPSISVSQTTRFNLVFGSLIVRFCINVHLSNQI